MDPIGRRISRTPREAICLPEVPCERGFPCGLFLRLSQNSFFNLLGHDNDTVEIGKDQIARLYKDLAAADGNVVIHQSSTSQGVQRADSRIVDWKPHLDYAVAVANLAITHAPHRAVTFRHGAHQLAPRRILARVVRRMDSHVPLTQRIDCFKLSPIGVTLLNVIGVHPAEGTGAADKAAVIAVGQQGPQPLMHGLITVTQLIQNVADSRYIDTAANECEVSVSLSTIGESPEASFKLPS